MRVRAGSSRTRPLDVAILSLLALLVLAPLSYYGEDALQRIVNGLRVTHEPWRIASRTLERPDRAVILRNWFGSAMTDVPRLYVDVKFKHYETLRRIRNRAIKDGYLFRSEDDMVPATLRLDGESTRARVRLKGDFLDHLETDKWSLRVETRGGAQLLGMRRFSLQAPHTRFYYFEPLFLDHVRREGVLAVRSRFVDVTLNGDRLGLMNVEEHFSKELLESQGKPEGVIVRFDETDFWQSYRRSQNVEDILEERGEERQIAKTFENWKTGRVKPFRPSKVAESELLADHADLAAGLLRGVAYGELKPSDVFDVELLARYLALCDVWGAWHPLRFHNVRFYLNPVTLKLEPVGFDGSIGKSWFRGLFSFRNSHLYSYFVADPQIAEAYRRTMKRFLNPDYLDELWVFLAERQAGYLRTLHRDFPDLAPFNFETIRRKYTLVDRLDTPGPFTLRPYKKRTIFDVEFPPQPQAVYAHRIDAGPDGEPLLELVNPLGWPVVVDAISLETESGSVPLSDLDLPLTLAPSYHDSSTWEQTPPPVSTLVRLPADAGPETSKITGKAHIDGQRHVYDFEAIRNVLPLAKRIFPREAALDELLATYPFLDWDGEMFRTRPGRFEVPGAVQLPRLLLGIDGAGSSMEHPGLVLAAGTTLVFAEEAYLRVGGPLHSAGSASAPVVLRAHDGGSWRGLLVDRSPERSIWTHTTVADTNFTRQGPWKLTGGVTFYESDLTLDDCTFDGTLAEDALNIIRSEFELNRLTIVRSASDGLDSDFSRGTIAASRFERVAGDAIDVSGSVVRVTDSSFDGVRDKALSVGESSIVHASGLRIRDVGAALASKDGSRAELVDSALNEIRHVALLAYNKKPEYGPASLIASSIEYDGSGTLQAAQRRHILTIDGKRMHTQRIDVEALYDSGFMKK